MFFFVSMIQTSDNPRVYLLNSVCRLNNELSRYLPRERQNLLEFSEDIDQPQGRKKTLPDVIVKEGAQAGKPETCAHKPSLLRTLFRTSGFKLMKSHLFRIVSELVLVLNPYLLKYVITYDKNHLTICHNTS